MRATRFVWSLLAILGLTSAGCGSGQPAATAPNGGSPATSPGEAQAQQPQAGQGLAALSTEEAEAFGQSLEAAMAQPDENGTAFNDAIDWTALLDKTTQGVEATPEFRKNFVAGLRRELASQGMGQQIAGLIRAGGRYKFLRAHEEQGQRRALFRLLLPNAGGVNFHDIVLQRSPNGAVKAGDVYVLVSGEMLSQTFRRSYVLAASSVPNGLVARLVGWESDFAKHASDFTNFALAVRQGRAAEALAIYRKLPPSLQRDKNFLLLRLQASQRLGDEEYAAAIEDLRRYYPADPCVTFLSIDGYALQKDYAQAMTSLNAAAKAIGEDPYFDNMRANIHLADEKFDEAREFANKAIAAEPTLIEAYWTLVAISLAEKRFNETARLLNVVRDQFKIKLADLTANPEYAEFVKSPEYAQWLKTQGDSQPSEP